MSVASVPCRRFESSASKLILFSGRCKSQSMTRNSFSIRNKTPESFALIKSSRYCLALKAPDMSLHCSADTSIRSYARNCFGCLPRFVSLTGRCPVSRRNSLRRSSLASATSALTNCYSAWIRHYASCSCSIDHKWMTRRQTSWMDCLVLFVCCCNCGNAKIFLYLQMMMLLQRSRSICEH